MILSSFERFALFLMRLENYKPASSLAEARQITELLLNDIENEFSGIDYNLKFAKSKSDGRLYAPQDDNCKLINEKGDMRCRTKGHYIYFGVHGAIRITTLNDEIILDKAGENHRILDE